VERLTGRSLSSTQDRVQLWLALHALPLAHPRDREGRDDGMASRPPSRS